MRVLQNFVVREYASPREGAEFKRIDDIGEVEEEFDLVDQAEHEITDAQGFHNLIRIRRTYSVRPVLNL